VLKVIIEITPTEAMAIDQLCKINDSFESEITKYPEYWANRKHVDEPPQFSRLDLHARRALAEDLHNVLEEAEAKIAR